jgi:hypothetical protein
MGLADENRLSWASAGVSSKYSLWYAQYDTMGVWNNYTPNKKLIYGKIVHWKNDKVAMYQYTPNGRVSGYNGALDLDAYYGRKSDWVIHSNNDTKGDNIEMVWHPKVSALDVGAFMVTKKKESTTVWDSSDVTKRKDTGKRLKYGDSFTIYDDQNAFLKIGKDKWVDSATGVTKKNKLHFNHKAKCTCIVSSKTRGYADTTSGKATGRTFEKGEKYIVHGYNNGYVLVGAGKDRYLSEKAIRIIL